LAYPFVFVCVVCGATETAVLNLKQMFGSSSIGDGGGGDYDYDDTRRLKFCCLRFYILDGFENIC
jgi:hypothetical protein